jgi:hypothetical protein
MNAGNEIGVYICSTYGDMEAERECLHTKVFPELVRRCAGLDVKLVAVDLVGQARSEDEAAQPQWLKRAFSEIDRCRPFFIGLLGERDERALEILPEEIRSAYPTIAAVAHRSRFGFEITHALRGSRSTTRGFHFYRRRLYLADETPEAVKAKIAADRNKAPRRVVEIEHDVRAAGLEIRDYDCSWDAAAGRVSDLDGFERMALVDLEASIRRYCEAQIEDSTTFTSTSAAAPSAEALAPPQQGTPIALEVVRAEQPSVVDAPTTTPKVYDENEPDPLEEVERQARQVLGEQIDSYRDVTADSAQAIPREGELTFVPRAEGIDFNPKSSSFMWQESVHREEFRLRARPEAVGRTSRGALTVFLGPILLAEVSISIRVEAPTAEVRTLPLKKEEVTPYRKLFPSYSHKDEGIVQQFERFARTLGDEYLRDVTHLRAGEVWSEQLRELIREADVFQLFWSWNSIHSPYVRQEWEFALGLAGAWLVPTSSGRRTGRCRCPRSRSAACLPRSCAACTSTGSQRRRHRRAATLHLSCPRARCRPRRHHPLGPFAAMRQGRMRRSL